MRAASLSPASVIVSRLWQLSPPLAGRIRYVLRRRGGERVCAHGSHVRPADDSHRYQPLEAVIANADHLVRLVLHPGELRVIHVGVLAWAVSSAEIALALEGRVGRQGRGRRRLGAKRGRGVWGRTLGASGGRGIGRSSLTPRFTLLDRHYRRWPFAEQRDPDHTHVGRPPGQGGIGFRQRRERERRHLDIALAPPGNLVLLPGREHVPVLTPAGGLAGDDVDTVDGGHREHTASVSIANFDRIARSRPAGDPILAM